MAAQMANFSAVLLGCLYQVASRVVGTPCSGTILSEQHCLINYGLYFFLFSYKFSKKISTENPNEPGFLCASFPLITVSTAFLRPFTHITCSTTLFIFSIILSRAAPIL